MSEKIKIYKEGLEKYLKEDVILGNFLMVLWIFLGAASCWFFSPLAAMIYFDFAVLMIVFVLRKALCANCYYYNKRCNMGWGKLSALFFKKGNIGKFNKGVGQKLAPITYGLLTAVPIVLILISIFQDFSAVKIAVLVSLLLISFYSGAVRRKKTCAKCKMRLICKGSAAK